MLINSMNKKELLNEIMCNNDGLYEEFSESILLNDEYTIKELRTITINWIIKNDECSTI